MTLRRKFFCTDWLLTNKSIYDIDTDEIPGFFHLLKNHIFTARSEDTIFIFHMWGYCDKWLFWLFRKWIKKVVFYVEILSVSFYKINRALPHGRAGIRILSSLAASIDDKCCGEYLFKVFITPLGITSYRSHRLISIRFRAEDISIHCWRQFWRSRSKSRLRFVSFRFFYIRSI